MLIWRRIRDTNERYRMYEVPGNKQVQTTKFSLANVFNPIQPSFPTSQLCTGSMDPYYFESLENSRCLVPPYGGDLHTRLLETT